MQHTRLLAPVGLDLQCIRRIPGDVQAHRHVHQPGTAIRATVDDPRGLIVRASVQRGIELVGDLAGGGVERNLRVVTLRRRHHAEAPVLIDDRHPIAGEICQCRGLSGLWALWLWGRCALTAPTLAAPLRRDSRWNDHERARERDEGDDEAQLHGQKALPDGTDVLVFIEKKTGPLAGSVSYTAVMKSCVVHPPLAPPQRWS